MKLAPPQNTLQPLPADIRPAVSQNIQRTASPTDIQNAQLSQQSQDITPGQTNEQPLVVNAGQQSSVATGSIVLPVILVIAVLLAVGAAWLWRSF